MNLTKVQFETLNAIDKLRGHAMLASSYNKNTLRALERRNLIRMRQGISSQIVFVTDAGRAALKSERRSSV